MKHAIVSSHARVALIAAFVSLAALVCSQPAPRERVGPLADGSFLLNSGWRLAPVGKQVPLDTLPMATALSPDGKYLLMLNGGYRPPLVSVIETASASVVASVPVADGWLGLAFAPKGDRVYVGGGSRAAIFEFSFAGGKLTPARTFAVVPEDQRKAQDFIGDVACSPDGRLLYAADLYRDSVVVVNPQSGMVIERYKTGGRPYRILFHPDGKSFFVSHWADGSLGHYDAASGSLLDTVRIGAHPTDIVWRSGAPTEPAEGEPTWVARLFVAAANTNNVYAVAVSSGNQLSVKMRFIPVISLEKWRPLETTYTSSNRMPTPVPSISRSSASILSLTTTTVAAAKTCAFGESGSAHVDG
jgi:YVTN family beta-propeller protein